MQKLIATLESLIRFKIHHLLFWVLYFLFWTSFYRVNYADPFLLYKITAVYLFAHAAAYYLSQYLLIPKLYTKNALLFVLAFGLLAVVLGLVMYGILSILIPNQLEAYFQGTTLQIIGIFTMSTLVISGVMLAIKSVIENKKIARKTEQQEKERLQSELQFLKSQVNPHFLFNTINSIYVLIKMDPDKASDLLIKLSNLLRAQLYEFSVDKIDIRRELDYLDNFIELEKIRKGNRLKLEFLKEGQLQGFELAPLMLIPFLENTFKHLSSYTDRPNLIQIRISRKGNLLEAEFFNTCDSNRKTEVGGIGLQNIKRRLELVYPGRYQLKLQPGENEYLVNLKIDISK